MTPPSQPTESPFLCLPQEVRQRIYKFLFTSRGTVHIDHLKRKRPSDGARQAAVPVSPQPVGFPLLSRAEQIQRVEDAVLGMHKVTSMWQYMHDLVQYHEVTSRQVVLSLHQMNSQTPMQPRPQNSYRPAPP